MALQQHSLGCNLTAIDHPQKVGENHTVCIFFSSLPRKHMGRIPSRVVDPDLHAAPFLLGFLKEILYTVFFRHIAAYIVAALFKLFQLLFYRRCKFFTTA